MLKISWVRYLLMASRDHHHTKKSNNLSFSCYLSFLFLSVLCLASLLLLSSAFRGSTAVSSFSSKDNNALELKQRDSSQKEKTDLCDYSDGMWIYEPTMRYTRYDNTCKEIFKGWNCISSNKSNALDIIKWYWQPKSCDLPQFDPVQFLEHFRNTNIGFVGDSLNRNMFASMVCTLKRASNEVKKWRPVGADRGFTFLQYNLTVAYHRTNLLARYGRWVASANGGALESLGYKQGFRVDVDIPESSWAEALIFHDILIFNTGHWWWAPSKFDPIKSPMLFFEKGLPVIPPISPEDGLDMVLKHMISFVERRTPSHVIKFFRTQSPRHFEGGDWDQGGSCQHVQPLLPYQVEQLFCLERNGTNVEVRLVNQHLFRALKGSSFHILDITRMSEFRADAHPSTAGGKKHNDCMHWCLPGITDSWNDLLVAHLSHSSS
ncbi:protein trichome birefringence-like 13 isoform X1 [Telopea speciosissima]|uniref:protein trichome birefringence-like 13 isoform X1 n=2 Tax=Telopea speciosissima TaxID=54955 RepID=UPI001CC66904|nr:protein trichome birefringence-like 13 isoform X1 [Telopea speciosissima]